MKSWEEGLLSFGSRWSLSIVSCGLLSFISLSSFWIWASDSSIFNLGGRMWERERFLIALRNFIPNAQVPGKAHDLGIYGARAICIGYSMLPSRVPDRFGREKRCHWGNIGGGGGGSVVTKLCLTLQSWTVAHQSPLSIGFPRGRVLEWVSISLSRASSWPRIKPRSPTLVGRFFTIEPPGKPWVNIVMV